MSRDTKTLTKRSGGAETRRHLQTILDLLQSARGNAHLLSVKDATAKAELLDGLALSELSALRMLGDEAS